MKKFILSFIAVGLFSCAPACSTYEKLKSAATGSNAVLTCKVIGAIANTLADDVAKMSVAKQITPTQSALFGTDFDKFQAGYRTEVAAIGAAHSDLSVPASSPLQALFLQLENDYSTFK